MSTQSDFALSAARPQSDRLILRIGAAALIALFVALVALAAHHGADPSFPTNLPVWELGVGYP